MITKKEVWATPDGQIFNSEADAQIHQAIVGIDDAITEAFDFTGNYWDNVGPRGLAKALIALGYRLTKEA